MTYSMNNTLTLCDGNLALCIQKTNLRVIEGGLSKQTKVATSHFNVMGLVLAIMALLALVWCAADHHAETKTSRILSEVGCETIVVGEGDTLWQIADARHVEGCTTARVVRFIREVNGLDSAMLRAGDRITVPQTMS